MVNCDQVIRGNFSFGEKKKLRRQGTDCKLMSIISLVTLSILYQLYKIPISNTSHGIRLALFQLKFYQQQNNASFSLKSWSE